MTEHASPHCACGINDAGQRYVDPICARFQPPEGLRMVAYRAARAWATEHRHPQPDDRMVDAVLAAIEAAGWRPESADDDRLYLDLKGARERLCRAQTGLNPTDAGILQGAIARIDIVACDLPQWSRHDGGRRG